MSKSCIYDLRITPRPGATDEAVAVEAAEARRSRQYTSIEIGVPAWGGTPQAAVVVGMFDGSREILTKLRAARLLDKRKQRSKGRKRA